MADQTEQQAAAAKAAAEKAEKEAKAKAEAEAQAAAAKAAASTKGKVVLVHEFIDPTGKTLPAGTELDASIEWVKRCVLPYDLAEPKSVYEAKKRVAKAVAEAEAEGKAAIEKAKQGED